MPLCNKKMTFEECELAILRSAVDNMDVKKGKKMIDNPEIKDIMKIVENFIKNNKLICYGGTAINNILPEKDQFYNRDIELPDYDFFSPTPLKHAKKLAKIYYKLGFKEVEAKSGVHAGTFKVFVNYIPVADITYLVPELFKKLQENAVKVDNILYSPPNYLRMLMYLELSRPAGDVSRWEKVLKRLTLLNKNYPLKGTACNSEKIQRIFETGIKQFKKKYKNVDSLTENIANISTKKKLQETIFSLVLNSLINQECIFFGAYANKQYYKKISKKIKDKNLRIPDFDVLSEEPQKCAAILKEVLTSHGFLNVRVYKRAGVGELIAPHYELRLDKETLLFIYEPIACHSYNVIKIADKNVRIATIDTMLSFYLAFLFIDREYYEKNRILCMCEYLFKAQQKNRLKQRGLLKRFSIECYGNQKSIQDLRAEKSTQYKRLKNNKHSKEYQWYFLRYIPYQIEEMRKKLKRKTRKKRRVKKSKVKKVKTKKNVTSKAKRKTSKK